jgi:sucrose-6-phosphate hydrolase SacC (GH32 family)
LRCELVAEDGSSVVIGLDLEASIAFVDRRAALPGQNRPPWGSTAAAHLPNLDGPLSLTVLVDEDSVELFTANGTVTITESVCPRGPWTTLRIEAVTGWCIIHSLDMQNLAEETVSHE